MDKDHHPKMVTGRLPHPANNYYFRIMKQMLCRLGLIALLLTTASMHSMAAGDTSTVTIVVEPVFNGAPLQLADQYYVNEHGDTLFIDLFRFYITNLSISQEDNIAQDMNSHLVDAEYKESCSFKVIVPEGSYGSVQFTIGVDSATNTNGANGGDLDPVKGMYWAWNSGYIMAKMEGRSTVCKTRHHVFQLHIGGYMSPYDAARIVNIRLPKNAVVKKGTNTTIHIKADAAAWFKDKLDLGKTNEIMIPGKDACMIADKYAQMFSVTDVTNE